MFFSQHFSFPLSVPFHHCSTLISIYILLLPERQTDETSDPSQTVILFPKLVIILHKMRTARTANLQTLGKAEFCHLDTTAVITQPFLIRSRADRWAKLIAGRFYLGPTGAHGSAQSLNSAIWIWDSKLSPFLNVHNFPSKSLLLPMLYFRCCCCYLLLLALLKLLYIVIIKRIALYSLPVTFHVNFGVN